MSPRFSLGVEGWTDSYLKSLENQLTVQNTDLLLNQRTLSLELGATWDLLHLPTSKQAPKRVLIQLHPQNFELPPAKKCFQTLSTIEQCSFKAKITNMDARPLSR